MPTILFIRGWRFFFYANEADEPIHIHCRKAEKECKYWLDRKNFDVEEALVFSFRMVKPLASGEERSCHSRGSGRPEMGKTLDSRFHGNDAQNKKSCA